MKFAKELEENAVPEWKDKYLNYKAGKKKLKAVARAIRNVEPQHTDASKKTKPNKSPFASIRDAPVYSFLQRSRTQEQQQQPPPSRDSSTPLVQGRSRSERATPRLSQLGDNAADATPRARPINERSPLRMGRKDGPHMARYGSIIGSPPKHPPKGPPKEENAPMDDLRHAPSLELPEPAMDESRRSYDSSRQSDGRSPSVAGSAPAPAPQPPPTQLAHRGNAYEVSNPTDKPPAGVQRYRSLFEQRKGNTSLFDGRPPFMRRMFSIAAASPGSLRATQHQRNADVALESYRELEFRQAEFFLFLDKEMQKIETFYKSKEEAAKERLKLLREQLHIMRDQRLAEVTAAEQKRRAPNGSTADSNGFLSVIGAQNQQDGIAYKRAHPLQASIDATREALDKVRSGRVGKTSQAMEQLGTPAGLVARDRQHEDYIRRSHNNDPPYRNAKRKLKIALAEFYRGLELLKSYAMQNRTAFRKINKKFDKTAASGSSAGRGMEYMGKKVNKAHFVQSSTPDDLLQEVEDLYARYFERGNHKVAVSKLRAKSAKAGDYYGAVLRTGLLLAAGFVLGIQGVVQGALHLDDTVGHPDRPTQTSYLLQIYAGYFLMLSLVGFFCIDTAVFARYKVNYQFIFEFDTRSHLDWKQLCELPAWFMFLLGLTLWLNFSVVAGGETMYVYWPVVLVGLSVILICLPPPLFYPRSRRWFLESNFRLLLAGLYPVEFRDFFLGDMFCSQTYALGNTEMFFCVYARYWKEVDQCNSGHSRLLGFFQCLPGVWRLLQCFRRYYDSGLWTHLANGLKYTATILQYMSLSLWRLEKPNHALMAFFIACATINSLYCTFWDLYYDWSMPMNLYHKPPLLRDVLAYRRHKWWYYVAIVLDPILRFNWIFYIIYRHDVQHSSIISFLIGLSEVARRGIWVLLRVENEHATNVGRYRAQRDPALPYEVKNAAEEEEPANEPTGSETDERDIPDIQPQLDGAPTPATMASAREDVERGLPPSGSLRQRRPTMAGGRGASNSPVYAALKRAGTTMLAAHALDYERRKPTKKEEEKERREQEEESDDDEDEDEDQD